jgi:hypothetical protein
VGSLRLKKPNNKRYDVLPQGSNLKKHFQYKTVLLVDGYEAQYFLSAYNVQQITSRHRQKQTVSQKETNSQ